MSPFKVYVQKRPVNLQSSGPFYLAAIENLTKKYDMKIYV